MSYTQSSLFLRYQQRYDAILIEFELTRNDFDRSLYSFLSFLSCIGYTETNNNETIEQILNDYEEKLTTPYKDIESLNPQYYNTLKKKFIKDHIECFKNDRCTVS